MQDSPTSTINKSRVPTHSHDKLIKKLLSNAATMRDILRMYLPKEISDGMDLNKLELQRDSFIDDEHRVFAVDILYKTKFKENEGYIWVLIEHQSTSDPWMPVRIFKYIAMIWDHLRKNSKKKEIPLIYPLIIYNGQYPYRHSLNLRDMIFPEASRSVFDTLFQKPFHLVDLTQIKDSALRNVMQENMQGVALLLTLKHIFDKNLQHVFEKILLKVYKGLDETGNRDAVSDMIYYLLRAGENLNKEKFWTVLHEEFSPEVEDNVMTIAQQLQAEGFKKGIESYRESVVRQMISARIDFDLIAKITGLSLIEIRQFKAK